MTTFDHNYSGISIKRSAKGLGKFVRYIEHLDLTNFRKKKQLKCSLYRGIANN